MPSQDDDLGDELVNLGSLSDVWEFESRLLLERSRGKRDSTTQKIANFAIENSAVFAPISMILSSAVGAAGPVLSHVANRRNQEADTRRRILENIIKLHGQSYRVLTWSDTIEIVYYVSWLVDELGKRLGLLKKVDLSVCDGDEAEEIKEKITSYDCVVEELMKFKVLVEARRVDYERKVKDHDEVSHKEFQEIYRAYSLEVDGAQRKLKNIDAKKQALLLSHAEAKVQEVELKSEIERIKSRIFCAISGCDRVRILDSEYCKKHTCREMGCLRHVDAVDKEQPLLFNKMLVGAAKLVGNENTPHILELMNMFCSEHQPRFNVDESSSGYLHSSETSPEKSVDQKFVSILLLVLPIMFVFYLLYSLYFTGY